eukprot:3979284-Prymnesium_polylepis.1
MRRMETCPRWSWRATTRAPSRRARAPGPRWMAACHAALGGAHAVTAFTRVGGGDEWAAGVPGGGGARGGGRARPAGDRRVGGVA